jgi:hypothetical protein
MKPLRRCSAGLLCIGIELLGCSQGGGYPAYVAALQAGLPTRSGPLSDPAGTIYGDADQVMCNLSLTTGPVELPARMCLNGNGTIEGGAFGSHEYQSSRTSSGTIEVPLNRQTGGVHYVPVKINDALTLDFLVDSGAASVSMPADVVLALVRLGTIAPEDFLGSRNYRLADGSSLPSETFQIRSLKVGGIDLQAF